MWRHTFWLLIIIMTVSSCATNKAATVQPPAENNETENAPSFEIRFPQITGPQNAYLEALIKGELVLENGCLRVKDLPEDSVLLIWDQRFSPREEGGIVKVINASTGQVLASVGDFVAVGGGFFDDPTLLGLKEPLPKDCPGPYYLVGETIKKIDYP